MRKRSRKLQSRFPSLRGETLEPRLVLDSTVVFNEIMYHPQDNVPGMEWIELHSQMAVDMDLSQWSISGGINYTFPEGTIIPGGGYLVVAEDPTALAAANVYSGAMGPFTGQLSNGGESVNLRDRSGRRMDRIDYTDSGDWPAGPDGSGVTLAKVAPDLASIPSENWASSVILGGTPGVANAGQLIQFNSEWQYDASGADLGEQWSDPDFNDDAWQTGTGVIYAGRDNFPLPAGTEISTGPVTFYFRTEFDFLGDPQATSLQMQYLIDDGAVFYLNGEEVLRYNMPNGPVTSSTLAFAGPRVLTVSETIVLPTDALRAGKNVFAVEVHQNIASSSDIVIGVDMLSQGSGDGSQSSGGAVVFNELAAAEAEQFFVELANNGPVPVSLDGYSLANVQGDEYLLGDVNLASGEILLISRQELGFDAVAGDRLFIYTPSKVALSDTAIVRAVGRSRVPDATGSWWNSTDATPGEGNTVLLYDKIVINEIMFNHRPDSPSRAMAESSIDTTFLPMTQEWRYDQSGDDLGTDWREETFDDTSWPEGPALLYKSNANLPVAKNTLLETGIITHYFRTEFDLAEELGETRIKLRYLVDDGAVFYLNGIEVERYNMPDGEVTATTLAAKGIRTYSISPAIAIDSSMLRQGTNVLAVEVHQSILTSNDVMLAAELLLSVGTPATPETPLVEIDDEWIELYNRSDHAVDLSGWQFDGTIDFDFPQGTVLEPDSYLVVANDAEKLQAQYPGSRILGNFSGGLSNTSDTLRLFDENVNLADTLRYYDGGTWPEWADGGGSSLELRDPQADNSVAQAWGASREDLKSEWNTYTFRGVAERSAVGPDNQWSEFVLGMLEAGEVLLDDIRVIQDPQGQAIDLIQNGTFESDRGADSMDAWRAVGNHRTSEVIVDVDDPDNHVLRFVASGSTEHKHNHVETTFADGARINNGTEYEISYRAKWIGGSNQLNARLYFNRLAHTNPIKQPALNGTPGWLNSVAEENIAPIFEGLSHHPAVPQPGEPVTVSVQATDPDGVAEVSVWYAVDGGTWTEVSMSLSGPANQYAGQIPGQDAAAIVQFYVEGADGQGATGIFPTLGRESRVLYEVVDGDEVATNGLHNFRIILTPSDADFIHTDINLMSNERMAATVIYRESEIFYDVGVRLKGSERGRVTASRLGFSVGFESEHLFRGVHKTVSIDRSEGVGFGQQEMLTNQFMTHAGNVTGEYNDLIQVIAPRQTHTGAAELQLARFTDVFLDGAFEDGSDGQLFEYELVYYPTSTDGGTEGYKRPQPDSVAGTAIRDLGDEKEEYRWVWEIKNNRAADDYDQLINFTKVMGLSGAAFHDVIADVIDVDQWLRAHAMATMSGYGDNYTQGAQHNAQFYVRPSDGRVLYFPHDLDAFPNSSYSVTGNGDLNKLLQNPNYRHAYYGHLQDIITTTYNTDYMKTWTDNYGSLLPAQNFDGHLNFVGQRSSFITSQINNVASPVEFAVTRGSDVVTVDTDIVSITGSGWFDVRVLRIAETGVALDVDWTSVTQWEAYIPVVFGENLLTLEAYNFQNELIGSVPLVITSTLENRPLETSLRVTELMYHAGDPSPEENGAGFNDDDFEYIELTNIGDATINLAEASFTDGIEFTFPAGPTLLAAGESGVLVANADAFALRYGDVPIAGVYSTKLSNGGETIRLETGSGVVIQEFTYDDQAPWPTAADGPGPGLEIIDPSGDYADPTNWRASGPNGTPGAFSGGLDGTNPSATTIALSGSEWSTEYLTFVSPDANTPTGVPLPSDDAAPNLLLGQLVDRISITFDEDVIVVADHLSVQGINIADYRQTVGLADDGFQYDAGTFTASWTFATPFAADRVQLVISDQVADMLGNRITGALTQQFEVLTGDGDHNGTVDIRDVQAMRSRFLSIIGEPLYDASYDLTGDGEIDVRDLQVLRQSLLTTLPDPIDPPEGLQANEPVMAIERQIATDDFFASLDNDAIVTAAARRQR